MAFCEVSQDQSPGTPAAAGDFGFKVLTSSDPAEKTKKLSAELANGRLAMMAIIGMFFQAGFHKIRMPGGASLLLWMRVDAHISPSLIRRATVCTRWKIALGTLTRAAGRFLEVWDHADSTKTNIPISASREAHESNESLSSELA